MKLGWIVNGLVVVSLVAGAGGSVCAAGKKVTVDTLAEVDAGTGGIEVDAAGNVYSSDFGAMLGKPETAGKKIWKITPKGKTSVFGEGFEGASGSAVDSKGNFYQANIRGNYVTKITPKGAQTRFASEGLTNPVGIVIDKQDNLYVANCGSASIQRIDKDGKSTRYASSKMLNCPNGITLDEKRNLYVANFMNGDVVKVTPSAEVSVVATLPGGNNGHLVYSGEALYVVDRGGHRIYKVELDGTFEIFAGSGEKGGADGPALESSFCFPNDIAVSKDGRSFYVNDVADEASQGAKLGPTRIRRIMLARKK